MRRPLLVFSIVALAGCQAVAPALTEVRTSTTARGKWSAPPSLKRLYAPLAHEGGIVFAKSIDEIADATQQGAAALLGAELAAELRASRAMADAALLAAKLDAAPAKAYGLAQVPAATAGMAVMAPPPPPPRFPGAPGVSPWFHGEKGPQPRDKFHAFERREAGDAYGAWNALSPDERRGADARHHEREQRLQARVQPRLTRSASLFIQQGALGQAVATDGTRTVTINFLLVTDAGERRVQVQRTYDAQGSLVQALEAVVGLSDDIAIDSERVRTFRPDGTVDVASDTRMTIDGRLHNVHWAKRVAADGGQGGTGTIVRPDASEVALTSTAAAEAQETIVGRDPSGLTLAVTTDASAAVATAVLDAGADGSAIMEIGVEPGPAPTP